MPPAPPVDPHRDHLRRLRAELTATAGMIERGAIAVTESVKLLRRLDGRAAAQPGGKADAP